MFGILVIASILGFSWLYGYVWRKMTQDDVQVHLKINPQQSLYANDTETLQVVIENRSWLPIPYFRIWLELPTGLVLLDQKDDSNVIEYTTHLLPYQRVSIDFTLCFAERGLHRFQYLQYEYHEGLGFHIQTYESKERVEILVRPPLLQEIDMDPIYRDFLGSILVKRWDQGDPAHLIGIRSYVEGDPIRFIHWAASARTGELLVKQFQPTSETKVILGLSFQFFEKNWMGTNKKRAEYQCSWALTLIHKLCLEGIPVELYTNAEWRGLGSIEVTSPSHSPSFDELADGLGMLFPTANEECNDLLERIYKKIHSTTTVILLLPYMDSEIIERVNRLAEVTSTVYIWGHTHATITENLLHHKIIYKQWPKEEVSEI